MVHGIQEPFLGLENVWHVLHVAVGAYLVLQWSLTDWPLCKDKLSHLWAESFMPGYVNEGLEVVFGEHDGFGGEVSSFVETESLSLKRRAR